MDNIDFEDFEDLDKYLLSQKGKIIHQIWFDNILPNKRATQKEFESLRKYRDSWILKNPTWKYMCWNVNNSLKLIKTRFSEHLEMYNKYPYNIQRCDSIRYFILHRYGGLYADMDYFCNRPFDEAISVYQNDLYLVESPNRLGDDARVSNSLMYSKPNHSFWKSLFIELEMSRTAPIYYGRHMTIMYTTGPCFLGS